MDDNKVTNLFVLLLILFIITYFYNVYKSKLEKEDVKFSYDEIKRFLNEKHNKPILWIFLNYEKNARNWDSFYSRNSFALNQGYLFLTVRTIVEKCKDDFHICLIDDNVFYKLLNEEIFKNMNKKSAHHKTYVRIYGICQLLYTYGGLFVPASFVCFQNLSHLMSRPKMFVGEFKGFRKDRSFTPCYKFMGCEKENGEMGKLLDYLKKDLISDYTAEPEFVGKVSIWLDYHIKQGGIQLISGTQLGTKSRKGKPIDLEDFLSTDYIDMRLKNILGVYVPQEELLKRIQYGWFVRMSPTQVLESNTFVGKLLLINSSSSAEQYSFFRIS